MTALAGMALLCEGSTTTQGKYAPNIRRAVDYLVGRCRRNGLIGDPTRDDRYTYGHGFSMLFLSQVLGEEEDAERREQMIEVLNRAVDFTGQAQTRGRRLGLRQRQGRRRLRRRLDHHHPGARAARLPQRRHSRAQGNHRQGRGLYPPMHGSRRRRALQPGHGGGGRPPITAAAIACLFNAGDYDSEYVPQDDELLPEESRQPLEPAA